MCCRVVVEMMSSRLDGILSVEQTVKMNAHLLDCPSCQLHWERLQLIQLSMEASAEFIPPLDFTARVLAGLDRPPALGIAKRPIWLYLGAIGIALGTLVFAALVWAGISSWHVISHPALVSKLFELARVVVSIIAVIGKALWSSFSLLDSESVGIVGVTSGIVSLLLLFLWARLLSQWWQLGSRERALW